MKAGAVLVLFGLSAGCVAAPVVTTAPSEVVSPSPATTAVSSALAIAPAPAGWVISEFGDAEPAAGDAQALMRLPSLRLVQEGATLRLTRYEYCGKPSEEATGSLSSRTVRLEGMSYKGRLGAPLIYALTYDAEAQRFRGTRNGQPVWLAPVPITPGVPYSGRGGLCAATVRGQLFDMYGQEWSRPATLTVESLNPSNPYESTVRLENGVFRVQGLPAQVAIRITVEAEGMKARSRDVTIERGPEWLVNFGGPRDREDPEGWKYPLEPLVKPSPLPSGPSSRV